MNLFEYTLRAVAYAIADPGLVLILVIMGMFLYRKNKRIAFLQRMMIGEKYVSPLELTLSQIVVGIAGGIIGSMILSYLGIMFHEKSGIELIFMVSLVLMAIKPRWICFSYSGAVLGLMALLIDFLKKSGIISTNFPITLDIVSLVSLIAVLHIVEGILITVDGKKGAIPVFTNKDGKLAGGFALERYWPIPLAIMFFSNNILSGAMEPINTPTWWPILHGNVNDAFLATAIISAMPLYAMIGYKSVTFTQSKTEKAVMSGISNIIYGGALLALSQLANYGLAFQILVLILMPLGHELMLLIQKGKEKKGKIKYASDEEGITVLEVMPNSMAKRSGIKSGDKILEVNDDKPEEYTMIYEALNKGFNNLKLKIKDTKGTIRSITLSIGEGGSLGIILIPKGFPDGNGVLEVGDKKFKDILDKIKKKNDKE